MNEIEEYYPNQQYTSHDFTLENIDEKAKIFHLNDSDYNYYYTLAKFKDMMKGKENSEEADIMMLELLRFYHDLMEMPKETGQIMLKNMFGPLFDEKDNTIALSIFNGYKKPKTFQTNISKLSDTIFDKRIDLSNPTVITNGENKKYIVKLAETQVITFPILDKEDGINIPNFLNQYDRAVLDSICSICAPQNNGQFLNNIFTAAQVYEVMTGKREHEPRVLEKIKYSIMKLQGSVIRLDWMDYIRSIKQNMSEIDIKKCKTTENMLVCQNIDVIINGHETEAYKLIKMPVIYRYASSLGQIATVKRDLVKLPMVCTQNNIIIQKYLLRRIERMKNKKTKSSNIIKFKTLYEECDIEGSYIELSRIRNQIDKILNNWKQNGYISDYEYTKNHNAYQDIIIKLA